MKHKILGLLPFIAALALTSCNLGGGNNNNPDKPGGNPDTNYPDKPGEGGGDKDPDKPGGGENPDKPDGDDGDKDPDKPGGGGEDKPQPPEVEQGQFLDNLANENFEDIYKKIKVAKTSFRTHFFYDITDENKFTDNEAKIRTGDYQAHNGDVDASTTTISNSLHYEAYTDSVPYIDGMEKGDPTKQTYSHKGYNEVFIFRDRDNPKYRYENYDKYTDSVSYYRLTNQKYPNKDPQSNEYAELEKLPRYKNEQYLANDMIKTKSSYNVFNFNEESLGDNYNKEKVSQLDRFYFGKDFNRKYISLKLLDKFVDAYKNRLPFPNDPEINCRGYARKIINGNLARYEVENTIGDVTYNTLLTINNDKDIVVSFSNSVFTYQLKTKTEDEECPFFKETIKRKGFYLTFYEKDYDNNDGNFEEGSVGYDHRHDDYTEIKENEILFKDMSKYPLLNLVYEKQYK